MTDCEDNYKEKELFDRSNNFSDNKVILKYMEELKEDLKVTTVNITQKALMVSNIRRKWLDYYFYEKDNYERALKIKKEYMLKKCSNKSISDIGLKAKNTDYLSENDEIYKKILRKIEMIKTNIDYLERVQNITADLGFTITNIKELLKLELNR